jgi:hypothetical protein
MQLYARVRDSFGATTDEYKDTVTVRAPFGRRLLSEFSWPMALEKVNEALQLKNTADTNMLSSCVATEANTAAAAGALALANVTGIVDTLVTYMRESVSSSPLSSDYVCEVAGVMSAVTAKAAYVSSNSVLPAVSLLNTMVTSDKMATVTTDCAAQFYTSFTSAMSSQNLLAGKDQLENATSANVVNTVESSSFRVMSLLAKALIEGMSRTVSVNASTNIVARQLATASGQTKTYTSNTAARGQQTYSVTMPDLMQQQQLGLASTDLVDTVLEFNDLTPFVAGSQILSMGVGITLAKGGTKLPVSDLSAPIVFTIPLVKSAEPAPPGLILQCKSSPSCSTLIRFKTIHVLRLDRVTVSRSRSL